MRNALTRHIGIVPRAQVILLAGALSLWSLPARAQAAPERSTDKAVKAQIEQLDESRDKFEGNLEGSLKDSKTHRPNGEEVKVADALTEYQNSVSKLKDKFSDDYSASTEVATVLKQATAISNFMKANPTVTKGRSEWDHHVVELQHLATAYGTTFPLPENAMVRRMNDKETADVAKKVAEDAERVKNEFDKVPDTALPNTDKTSIKGDLDLIIKQAEAVESRVDDQKPATAEVRQLVAQVTTVQRFVAAHPTPTVTPNWDAVRTGVSKLQQAFGLAK